MLTCLCAIQKKKDWSQEGERAFGGGMSLSLPSSKHEANTTQTATTATYTTASKSQEWALVARMGKVFEVWRAVVSL